MKPETEGKAGHTDTPWALDAMGYIRGPNGENVLENKANAEYVCAAVNAHEELLASLKETRDAAAYLMRVLAQADTKLILKLNHRFDGFGKRAKEAIAKAEAKS